MSRLREVGAIRAYKLMHTRRVRGRAAAPFAVVGAVCVLKNGMHKLSFITKRSQKVHVHDPPRNSSVIYGSLHVLHPPEHLGETRTNFSRVLETADS